MNKSMFAFHSLSVKLFNPVALRSSQLRKRIHLAGRQRYKVLGAFDEIAGFNRSLRIPPVQSHADFDAERHAQRMHVFHLLLNDYLRGFQLRFRGFEYQFVMHG